MNKLTAEKKLELVRRLRETSDYNQSKLSYGSRLLYGEEESAKAEGYIPGISILLRSIVAILLFIGIAAIRLSGLELFGFDYNRLHAYLSETIDLNSFDFTEDLPYTLTVEKTKNNSISTE